ncbi:MAG: single-stranded-DNA-specific exonuclease RecJ [Betaproteobacteria bacterium]|nr:single-stranded-DNA-specific exonuclease RecJ [Betaproteobacteria bacterium]
MRKTIIKRQVDDVIVTKLIEAGVSPLLARLYAARGVKDADALSASLNHIIPPNQLTNSAAMAKLLADAIADKKKILIVGDYDADGATATAVAVKGLLSMGAQVDFLVPNRFEYGYGLTPKIVQLAATMQPDVIVTVDNGIASVDGVFEANKLGIQVLITDHHLPSDETPQAACIVNPNQHGCDFPSKNLAGVGVMFYVLLALRAELRERGIFAKEQEPNLTELLDLVALGTVADLVKLDANNRILVEQGLRRIRAGACCAGISALLKVAGRNESQVGAQDLGFYVGPRLNAAGRLDDMRLGIQCLLASEAEALDIAQSLHDLNAERRSIESSMQDEALASLDNINVGDQYSISLFESSWHQGVVGILASRIKEQYHRPVIAFAESDDGLLKGSGRSIAGLHLRDALDMVTKRHPNLIVTFGGHAMAAGLTINQDKFFEFQQAFEDVVRELLTPADLQAVIETDGGFAADEMNLYNAQLLANQVWGQGFAPPLFSDTFSVINQRIVGAKHLKVLLEKQGKRFDAIYFGQTESLPVQVEAVYQLQVNSYNGVQSVQLQLLHTA